MITVAVARSADEDGRDHERANYPNHSNRIVENAIVSPLSDGLGLRLREPVVDDTSPVLVDAVIPACC